MAAALALTAPLACASPSGREGAPSAPDAGAPSELSQTRWVHGVTVQVALRDVPEEASRPLFDAAFAAAEEVAALVLVEKPGSEADLLRRVPPRVAIAISPPTGEAIAIGTSVAEQTEGAYDYTLPPLLELWGLRGPGALRVPSESEIAGRLKRVFWGDVEVSLEGGHLSAQRLTRRTDLDFRNVARGLMLDAAAATLRAAGVRAGRASSDFAHAAFVPEGGAPWRVPILARNDDAPGAARVGTVLLAEGGLAVASLGPVFVAEDGTRVHDYIDPRSGRPADARGLAVVAAPRAAEAAAWADALFVMGAEGRALIQAAEELRAAGRAREDQAWSTGLAIEWEPERAEPGS